MSQTFKSPCENCVAYCFGETRAALEALAAADVEQEPADRAAYARIAADEERHAALAFRFVRWALEQDCANVVRSLEHACAAVSRHDSAAHEVVVPCLLALIESAGVARTQGQSQGHGIRLPCSSAQSV